MIHAPTNEDVLAAFDVPQDYDELWVGVSFPGDVPVDLYVLDSGEEIVCEWAEELQGPMVKSTHGKLYAEIIAHERMQVEITARYDWFDRGTPGDDYYVREPLETDTHTLGRGDLLYFDLRPGQSKVAIEHP